MAGGADVSGWITLGVLLGLCVLSALWTLVMANGLKVRGHHILITGATKGLGLAIAKRYARHADITDAADMDRVVCEANEHHGRVTDEIVCAAETSPNALFAEVDAAAMHAVMNLNYFGVVNSLKAALPAMIKKGVQGRIVLVSSVEALAPTVGSTLFTGSKFALRGLAETLRNEVKLYGMKVCVFYPGSYTSPFPRKTTVNETACLLTDMEKQADALMNGLRAGYFTITCSPSDQRNQMTSTWWMWPAGYVALCALSYIFTKLRAPGFNVDGKHVFITGGSSGLGLSLATKLAKAGAKISIVARSIDKLEAAKKEIEAVGKNPVFTHSTDVADFESVKSAVAAANAFHQRPTDTVVCCAGLATPGYFVEQDVSVFRKMMDLNYFGVVHTIKAALPAMIEAQNKGDVVIVASGCSMLSFIGYTQYASSKYALRGLAEALRNELKLYNIRVSVFYPGNIDSPGFVEENKIKPDETKEIEGTSKPESPDAVADSLISGLRDGQFSITNDPLIYLLRQISNGVAPRHNTPFEVLLFPISVLVQVGFGIYMDLVVTQSAKKKAKKEKAN
ncbi:hypothetical protein P43SY_009603 [Pythium insidiosum]|uniref:3-dehydrosphinganine reductase n=1 Tax=Pythium insidiosum TaxID=114742 RepID=A0AAD5QCY4_PYTIN|nr:hypothetical protein P43SY_009603 [Pythium insidiosum]